MRVSPARLVRENATADYITTVGGSGLAITGTPGNNQTGITFGNFLKFSISGIKYDDNDNNGIDAGDGRLAGVTVYVDLNNNDTFDNDLDAELEAGEDPFAVTDANGAWTISGLGPTAGGKEVREVTPPGYTQTVGQDGTVVNTDYLVTATSGNNSQTAFNFANFLPFGISGKKVIDTNGDGSIAGDNTAHAGVTIYIDFDNDGVFDAGEKSAITDGSGNWSITGLDASFTGKLVRENATADYITTVGGNGIAITGNNQTGVDFGNFQKFSISGIKYDDNDNNGIDAGDGRLAGVTVYVDLNNNDTFDNDLDAELEAGEDPFAVTDANGAWTISGLGPTAGGKEVREVTPPGYTQTVGQDGTVVNTDYLVTATSGNNSQTAFNFANFLPFGISGKKVIDTNGDGSIAGDNTAHAGVTIYIDFDNDGVFDAGEKSAITDGSGNWSITGLDSSFTGKLVRENVAVEPISPRWAAMASPSPARRATTRPGSTSATSRSSRFRGSNTTTTTTTASMPATAVWRA